LISTVKTIIMRIRQTSELYKGQKGGLRKMHLIRNAAVAGLFYPDDPQELRHAVSRFLSDVTQIDTDTTQPKALIVPHAGYVYSGAAAATGFARLLPFKQLIKQIVLLGPSHRVGFTGLAVSDAHFYQTPLGDIPIDRPAIDKLLMLPQVSLIEQAHTQEHSVEVQLPFLQEILDDFTLVPIVVGDASTESVSEVLETLWGNESTLILISSDLSHFHNYPTAQQLDNITCSAIEMLHSENIGFDNACGRNPIKGLLHSAKQHDLAATTLALWNSYDSAGRSPEDKTRVVGYGCWMFTSNK
jgi:AmmeMemoRadiSam system protein B